MGDELRILFAEAFAEYTVVEVDVSPANMVNATNVHGYARDRLLPAIAIVDEDGDTFARGVDRNDAMLDGLAREIERLQKFEDDVHEAAREVQRAKTKLADLIWGC